MERSVDFDLLRSDFARIPAQATGLPLALALEAAGLTEEALAVAEQSMTYEKDFSQSELTPWNIEYALQDLFARLKFPRESIGEHTWEWPGARDMTYGARTYGTTIFWYVHYPTAKESGIPQTLSNFVAYGPHGSPSASSPVVRELARRPEAEGRPWFQRYCSGEVG